MRQGLKPLADYRANRGFSPLAPPKKPGFLLNLCNVTKFVKTLYNDPLSSNPALTGVDKPCNPNKNKKFSTCAIGN